jgi:hypothetical protein
MQGDEIRALRRLQREQGVSSHVFMTERGGPMTPKGFHALLGRIGVWAGMPFPVHPHMLRHGCGYALANAGHDTRSLQAWLGHKNIQHTVRYTELAPDRFKNFWVRLKGTTTLRVFKLKPIMIALGLFLFGSWWPGGFGDRGSNDCYHVSDPSWPTRTHNRHGRGHTEGEMIMMALFEGPPDTNRVIIALAVVIILAIIFYLYATNGRPGII